jgi:hypothetical protein
MQLRSGGIVGVGWIQGDCVGFRKEFPVFNVTRKRGFNGLGRCGDEVRDVHSTQDMESHGDPKFIEA